MKMLEWSKAHSLLPQRHYGHGVVLLTTSSNHAEILAMHESSQECVWLRLTIYRIQTTCGLSSSKMILTVIYEDNVKCIAQQKEGYIKRNRTKHISLKFFFTHDLQNDGEIDI